MTQLPQEFVLRMKNLLGDEYEAFESALSKPSSRALRVNTQKLSTEEFEKICDFEIKKIPYVDNGYYFDCDRIGNHPFHHAGMIYVQEPAAMASAECLDFEGDLAALDLCAAPGGKSSQIANKLSKNSVLVSNEIVPSRAKILTGNVERLGLENVITTCMDSSKLARLFPKTFDLIMVDAPCSGEGMFRKDEVARQEWSAENVKMCAERQAEILENAAKMLKGGGHIIYATCTFAPEENEMLIDSFLTSHEEFEIVTATKRVIENTEDGIIFEGCRHDLTLARRFYPHKNVGEGQFMAVLKNKLPQEGERARPRAKKPCDKSVFEFLDSVLASYDRERVEMRGETPVFAPDFDTKNATVFSCGVTIGEIRRGYILPHHQFFMAKGRDFKNKIELAPDSAELLKFLKGEEFDTPSPDGWAVVTVGSCSVGGVKVSRGRAKNHYPKGLRLK